MIGKTLTGAAVLALGTAVAASAATVNTISNVVFIVDESNSMSGEHQFLEDVIDDLDSALSLAGVTDRSYGVIGFGAKFSNPGSPRLVGSMADAATTKISMGDLRTNGGTEDGYSGIEYALNNLTYSAGAAINYVLVTDEDRDNSAPSLSYSSVLQSLTDRNILLNAIVDAGYSSDGGSALGIDSTEEAYVADGSGGYFTSANGVAGSGYGSTVGDYVDMALATGGAAWDLNKLRAGDDLAESFTKSFLDIKVQEITTQPTDPDTPVVPLPAGLPLLIAGMGIFGVARRLKRRA